MLRLRLTDQELRPAAARIGGISLIAALGFLVAAPALAHHPFGGQTPSSAVEGFLSGLGHPVVGLDHLAFVIAAGLLAAAVGRGLMIPVSFVLASLAGTGLHLLGLNLPAPEFTISASVLMFGGILALKHRPQTVTITALAALSGLFHGYAYGEAVVGAEMTPLVAYLLGFAVVQGAIAAATCWVANHLTSGKQTLGLRFAGFALAGAGAAFLSGVVLG
ncbi:MAG: HupE/UreJ family protein [Elainellaceae cyanobacterium]